MDDAERLAIRHSLEHLRALLAQIQGKLNEATDALRDADNIAAGKPPEPKPEPRPREREV